jgi:hypothetical protein
MLKSLVSPRSNATEHIEAVIAERDFFREKYAAQMNEMEDLRNQLKESSRVIDRLRRRVLDLECENNNNAAAGVVNSGGEDVAAEEGGERIQKSVGGSGSDTVVIQDESTKSNFGSTEDQNEQSAANTQQEQKDDEEYPSEEEKEDEANQIRANAERLLQWSNYQSRRSSALSPTNSTLDDKNRSFNYEEKTNIDVSPNESTRSSGSDPTTNNNNNNNNSPCKEMEYSSIQSTSGGKMSKFLNGLKEIIDPPLLLSDDDEDYSDDDERDESSDEESGSIDHRSLDG